jgi:hypothetical protein
MRSAYYADFKNSNGGGLIYRQRGVVTDVARELLGEHRRALTFLASFGSIVLY